MREQLGSQEPRQGDVRAGVAAVGQRVCNEQGRVQRPHVTTSTHPIATPRRRVASATVELRRQRVLTAAPRRSGRRGVERRVGDDRRPEAARAHRRATQSTTPDTTSPGSWYHASVPRCAKPNSVASTSDRADDADDGDPGAPCSRGARAAARRGRRAPRTTGATKIVRNRRDHEQPAPVPPPRTGWCPGLAARLCCTARYAAYDEPCSAMPRKQEPHVVRSRTRSRRAAPTA